MNPLVASIAAALLLTAQHPMPAGMSHEEHLKELQKAEALKKRGADAMGFDQETTTHHFILTATGGSIEVTVENRTDDNTLASVRSHLRAIASQFASGDFDKPFQAHGEAPPGVVGMQTNRSLIAYRYDDRPYGGAVRIDTADARALDAVHAFLRYQITEHRTGDPLEVKP